MILHEVHAGWLVLVEGRALKMLLYSTVSLQVASYHIKYINNFVSKVTSRKNQISQKRYRLSNRLLQCPFPRRSNILVAWVSHDFPFRRACLTQLCAGLFLWKSPDLHYGLLARQVVERQLNHNMTFQVPAQKFTSLGVKFETLVTKGLLSYSAKSRTVSKSSFQNCCTVCWWLLNYFKE